MRSPKLVLVLIAFGIALIVTGVMRIDMTSPAGQVNAAAPLAVSWTVGLVGCAVLAAGLWLLRKSFLLARARNLANPPVRTLSPIVVYLVLGGIIAAISAMALTSH